MQAGVATVENGIEVAQKSKNRVTIWYSNPTPGHISRKNSNRYMHPYVHPMFIAALFTIAKTWKWPKRPSTSEWIKKMWYISVQFTSVQSLSRVQLFATPWTEGCQVSLAITNSQSLLKLMSIESVMLSNHLIFCCPLLLPSIFPSIRMFYNESVLCIRWPKYWSFSQHHSFQWISGLILF